MARDLDLRPDMLRRWRQRYLEDPQQAFPGNGRMKPEDEELRRLRRELRRLREERAILKNHPGRKRPTCGLETRWGVGSVHRERRGRVLFGVLNPQKMWSRDSSGLASGDTFG